MNRIPSLLVAAAFGISSAALADNKAPAAATPAPAPATPAPAPAPTTPAPAPAAPTKSEMEIFAAKIKADKKLVVSQNLALTEDEAKKFWPVYDAYQAELTKLNERLGKNILAYAEAYKKGPIDNATAKKILEEAMAIDAAEVKFKAPFVGKLEKAVPMTKAARYMQIENKIRALIKMELAAGIPLVD